MTEEQICRELEEREELDEEEQWFQQNDAPPHTTYVTMAWFREKFGEHLISCKAEMECAPQPPDQNPPDFFFWGFLKDNIYRCNTRTIAASKATLTEKIQAITREECAHYIQQFLQLNGGHLEYMLYGSSWHF